MYKTVKQVSRSMTDRDGPVGVRGLQEERMDASRADKEGRAEPDERR